MLWAGILGEDRNVRQLSHPSFEEVFIRGIAAVLPFAAAFISSIFIIYKIRTRSPSNINLWGPLGLTVIYGLVGVFSSFQSPNIWVSIYWSASYLAVPIVLLSIAWGEAGLERVRRWLVGTWAMLLFVAAILFALAFIKLDFESSLSSPLTLWGCDGIGSWYQESSGAIRSTGVGRYAALAALLSISGLWWRGWRIPAAIILICSLTLLLSTGARTAIVGLLVAASLVTILYGGKKAAIGMAIGSITLLSLGLTTGFHKPFFQKCLFHGGGTLTVKPRVDTYSLLLTPDSRASDSEALSTDPNLDPNSSTTPLVESNLVESNSSENESEAQPSDTNLVSEKSEEEKISEVKDFFSLTGRTTFWGEGLSLYKDSPIIGRGFHADRMLIGDHIHNAYIYALLQTGTIGFLAFISALVLAWVLLVRLLLRLRYITGLDRAILIHTTGIAAFFAVRTIPESTGAFFSVDWLILAPILLYVQLLHRKYFGKLPK